MKKLSLTITISLLDEPHEGAKYKELITEINSFFDPYTKEVLGQFGELSLYKTVRILSVLDYFNLNKIEEDFLKLKHNELKTIILKFKKIYTSSEIDKLITMLDIALMKEGIR